MISCSQKQTQADTVSPDPPALAHFADVTDQAGLDFRHGVFRWDVSGDSVAMMGGGLCWIDYNQDGWLDLYVVNSYALAEASRWEANGGLPRNALFRNDAGRFTDVSEGSGADLAMRGNGCVTADFNLDGWPDLYVTSERVNALLWNNGDGTFTQDAEGAQVDAYGWQTGTAVGDLNDDGLPDLFVAGYVDLNNRIPGATQGFPNTHIGRRDLLFMNEGIGPDRRTTFREIGVEAGLESDNFEYGLGALFTDLDNDGDLDLLLANDTNPNRLYENVPWPDGKADDPNGIGFRFVEVGQYANIADKNSGMGVASGDYDNDGRFDILITNRGQQLHSVYNNQSAGGQIQFEDATNEMGVANIGAGWTGWGTAWADIDHDTDLDLIVVNGTVPVLDPPNDTQQIQLFANLTAQGLPGLFQDLTDVAGFDEIEPLLSRGSALADYDNDGDLDMAISTIGGRLALMRNETEGQHWLTVDLQGFYPGTIVKAQLPDGRELLCEVKAGSSYLSSEDPRCNFGLGPASEILVLEVHWPDRSQSRLNNIAADQILAVTKEDATSPPVDRSTEVTQEVSDQFLFELLLKDGGARPMEILPPASPEIIELGEALFWDKELSGNRDVACVTCHHPLAGSGDDLSVSIGVGGTGFAGDRQLGPERELIPRNATEIFNRGVKGWQTMFWDGRVSGSEARGFISPAGEMLPAELKNVVAIQALFPVTSRDEMRGAIGDEDVYGSPNEIAQIADNNLREIWATIMDRLLQVPGYRELFAAAFPDIPPEWLRFQHAANAIAAYEMEAFTHIDSPWDRYLAGEETALKAKAKRGASLFFGEAGCSQCHNGSLLTDQDFHNIGVPQIGPGKGDEAPFDYGRGRETGLDRDRFAFRTPPLRNVSLTGPWMHNGAYMTLEGAVKHHLNIEAALDSYDVSQLSPQLRESYQIPSGLLLTLDPLVSDPTELTDQQFDDLMDFLFALTSPSSMDGCELVPDSVPSGLPVDTDPTGYCDSET